MNKNSQPKLLATDYSVLGSRSMKNLVPHPLNERIYGREKLDQKLVMSIRQHGVLSPIIIDRKKRILSGHCRFLAAQEVGRTTIPAITFSGTETEAELLLIESNRQREKTPEQRAREFKELKRIEGDLAEQRMLAGTEPDPSVDLRKGRAVNIAAEKVGLKPRTAEKLEKIVLAADTGNKRARTALDKINETGRGVDSAYDHIVQRQQKKAQKTVAQEQGVELRRLFSRKVELQASRDEGRFNLFFYKQTEAQIREIAKALA